MVTCRTRHATAWAYQNRNRSYGVFTTMVLISALLMVQTGVHVHKQWMPKTATLE